MVQGAFVYRYIFMFMYLYRTWNIGEVFTIYLSSMFLSQHIPSFISISTHLFLASMKRCEAGLKPRKCPRHCVTSFIMASGWKSLDVFQTRVAGCLVLVLVNAVSQAPRLRGFQLRHLSGALVNSPMLPPALYLTADSQQGSHTKWANLDCKGCKPMRLSVCVAHVGQHTCTQMFTFLAIIYFCKMSNLHSCDTIFYLPSERQTLSFRHQQHRSSPLRVPGLQQWEYPGSLLRSGAPSKQLLLRDVRWTELVRFQENEG